MASCVNRRQLIGGLAAGACGTAVAAGAPKAAPAPARVVALTFDDLPFAGALASPADLAEAAALNRKVLDILRKFAAPAVGFVIGKSVERLSPEVARDILMPWTRGAFSLGNHTYSHADTNALDLDAIEQEVVKADASIRPLMTQAGKPLRFIRFAMNHTGDTLEKSLAIEGMLGRHGYTPAASTIDTSDYVFEAAYQTALRNGDAETAGRIRDAYVAYSETEIDYYAALGRQVLGYEPREVAILHLNRINADTLERLLDIYVRKGFAFVTLDEAQNDPAYTIPTTFATRFGPMWAYRWAKEKGVRVDGALEQDPPAWIANYTAGKPG